MDSSWFLSSLQDATFLVNSGRTACDRCRDVVTIIDISCLPSLGGVDRLCERVLVSPKMLGLSTFLPETRNQTDEGAFWDLMCLYSCLARA
jgi:hypothetical protein